jgi:hypothetical protein
MLGMLLPTVALADLSLNPYFGADVGIKHIGFKSGYGDKMFKSNQPTGSIFAGVEVCPNLDVGITLERTLHTSKKKETIGQGVMMFGKINRTGASVNTDSKAKFSSIGIDLIYKFSFTEYEKFKPLIGVGIKRVKAKLTSEVSGPGWSDSINLSKNNSKTIFKLMAGAEYMFTNHFGGRVLLNFENTARLKPNDVDGFTAKLKNSFGGTVGAIVRI